MNSFIKEIKKPSDETKKKKIVDIIITIINSDLVLSFEELEEKVKDIRKNLSEDEMIAAYNLAIYLKKNNLASKSDNRLNKFIDIDNYCSNDEGNLMKFINEIVKDIQEERKRNLKRKWQLQVNKIFDRMEGKNPYQEEMKYINARKENIYLVK